ncbi:cytochrome P450 [Spirillospora sp. NPDC052269]
MPPTGIAVPNLTDPATYAAHDMPALWRRLRADDPVHRHPETASGPGFWVLSRYEDVAAVLKDDERFTSEKGNVLATMLAGGDTGAGRMMAVTDGAHHTALRRLLLQAFSPRALAGVADRVHATTRRLLLAAVERGECDFARDVASVIPLETICDLLAVPPADRPAVLRLTKKALASDYAAPEQGEDWAARNEIMVYFSDLVDERRRRPGDDPISLMAAGEVNGRRLDDVDIVLNCYSLIMGGDETSRLAMIGAARELAHRPDQWAALSGGAVPAQTAAEEVLRWTTPTMHFGRVAVADVALRGRTVSAGDLVTVWLASANRDEAVFPDPDRFVLARTPNRHLSLGYGRHFCLGAYLGRVEIIAMLEGLREHVGSLEQTGPEQCIHSNFLAGMSSLPLAISGRPSAVRR